MDWLNNWPDKKRRRSSDDDTGPKFYYGIGPDDSLNSSHSEDEQYSHSPTESSVSSKGNLTTDQIAAMGLTTTEWQNTAYNPPFYYKIEDFARLATDPYPNPLIIRLYKSQSGPRAQVGDYENVLMTEMIRCYTQQDLSPRNLLLLIETVDEDTFPYYEEGLTRLLQWFRAKQKNIERCVFWMECYFQAPLFSDILSTYCRSLLELNIGGRRRTEVPLRHPPYDFDLESERLLTLLDRWVLANDKTIRCLRIYSFIQLDEQLMSLVNLCPKLQHLTLSKTCVVNTCCEFPNIKSLEFDKQELAYTDNCILLMKRMSTIFPTVRKIRVTRSYYSNLVEILVSRLAIVQNRNFEVFQDEIDLSAKERSITTKTPLKAYKKRISDESNLPKAIHFRSYTYRNNLLLLNGAYTYHTPMGKFVSKLQNLSRRL